MRWLALLVAIASAGGVATASPASQLDEARTAFREKDCNSAMKTLSLLLFPGHELLARQQDLVEAHAMFGACKCDSNDHAAAVDEFNKVLQLDPDHTLGELLFSSCALRTFAEAKADLDTEKKRREAQLQIERDRKALEDYKASLRVFREQPYVLNYLPGGAGQFSERRFGAGLFFATAEGVTLGVSGGVWLYLVGKYGIVSHSVALADGPGVRRLQEIEIGTGVAFILVYLGGIIDSLRHYEPRQRVTADESLLKDLDKRPPPPKKTSLRDRLHFGPIVTAGGLGIGLALEND